MKKILQLSLLGLLILTAYFFYIYFLKINEPSRSKNELKIKNDTLSDAQNNLIKNLKYEVKFENNTQYIISAKLSELNYVDENEIVKMQTVSAKFIDEKNMPLEIKSKNAIYNNFSYNTQFSDNVEIKYMNNAITADNVDLDFEKNNVTIYNNVVYEGQQGKIKSDNVRINLITKNAEIYMNDSNNKVEVQSK